MSSFPHPSVLDIFDFQRKLQTETSSKVHASREFLNALSSIQAVRFLGEHFFELRPTTHTQHVDRGEKQGVLGDLFPQKLSRETGAVCGSFTDRMQAPY